MSINQHILSRFGLACDTGSGTEGSETIGNILTRRSHRAFTRQPVAADMLCLGFLGIGRARRLVSLLEAS